MGPTWVLAAPRWAQCWPSEQCYQGEMEMSISSLDVNDGSVDMCVWETTLTRYVETSTYLISAVQCLTRWLYQFNLKTSKGEWVILHFSAETDWIYRQTSNISRPKSRNLNVSRLVLDLFLTKPLTPGVKSRMKMKLDRCCSTHQEVYCLLRRGLY